MILIYAFCLDASGGEEKEPPPRETVFFRPPSRVLANERRSSSVAPSPHVLAKDANSNNSNNFSGGDDLQLNPQPLPHVVVGRHRNSTESLLGPSREVGGRGCDPGPEFRTRRVLR